MSALGELAGARVVERQRVGRLVPPDPRQHAPRGDVAVIHDAELDGVQVAPHARVSPLHVVGHLAIGRQCGGTGRDSGRADGDEESDVVGGDGERRAGRRADLVGRTGEDVEDGRLGRFDQRVVHGVQPPAPDWGLLVAQARGYMTTAPWMLFFPCAGIATLVVGVNLMSDGLKQILQSSTARD